MARHLTPCGDNHPVETNCPECVRVLTLRAELDATPAYDVQTLDRALKRRNPSLKGSLVQALADHRGDCGQNVSIRVSSEVLDYPDIDADYRAWVQGLVDLLGEAELDRARIRIWW